MPSSRSRSPKWPADDFYDGQVQEPEEARAHSLDSFGVTAPWLWAIRRVWGRDDCVRCGARFEAGDRVRWLPSAHRGDGYALAHVACIKPDTDRVASATGPA